MSDQPILFDKPFPETQVRSPYQQYHNKIMGNVTVTSGFMEPYGHGYKSRPRKAIYRNRQLKTIQPGNYNIGFDYTKGFGSNVTCMYSGVVHKTGIEGGYGHRIHVKLDTFFAWQNKSYVCYQAYAHNSKLLKVVGQRVSQGEAIAIEAGHGGRHPRQYGSHVDLDTYFYLNGEPISINFELLAEGLDISDYIEQIEVMRVGSKGLDVSWLQQNLGIFDDGIFGRATKSAVKQFQAQEGLTVDGIAGEQTCVANKMFGYAIYPNQDTVIKISTEQSSELTENQRYAIVYDPLDNPPLLANWVQDANDHWKFELQSPLYWRYNWYAYKPHVGVVKGYDAPIDDDTGDLEDSILGINLDIIKEFEGYRQDAYLDAVGVPTIGYGATFYPDGRKVQMGDKLKDKQAGEDLLKHLIETSFLPDLIKIPTWAEMNVNQQSAVLSFAYNLGSKFFDNSGFESITRLLKEAKRWKNRAEVRRVFGLYVNAGGKTLQGLVRRRKAEADLFLS